jgi:hypothetical protein
MARVAVAVSIKGRKSIMAMPSIPKVQEPAVSLAAQQELVLKEQAQKAASLSIKAQESPAHPAKASDFTQIFLNQL